MTAEILEKNPGPDAQPIDPTTLRRLLQRNADGSWERQTAMPTTPTASSRRPRKPQPARTTVGRVPASRGIQTCLIQPPLESTITVDRHLAWVMSTLKTGVALGAAQVRP